MRTLAPLFALSLLTTPAIAKEIASPAPDPARLKATVEKLVSFGTRHTLSSPDDPVRGIGAARKWVGGEMTRIADACGGCITVANIARTFTNARAPNGVNVVDVLGFQQGLDPKRVVIVGAHIDSRISDGMDFTHDAPGANDDGSGVALVMEAARILSKEKFRATIVYAVFSGEEQGLFGGTLLAETAKQRGWTISAMLNNDIVGNTLGQNGVRITDRVRVFSEGIRESDDLPANLARRSNGGEDDSPSRSLAKTIDTVAATIPGGLGVFVDRRPDRFGRGGDHEPFLKLGYPAVRFSVGAENYTQQHQDVRTENGIQYGDTIDKMDFPYLAKVTAINIATLRRLASAPAAPGGVTIAGAVATDTTVKWEPVEGAVAYRIHVRPNNAQDWKGSVDVPAPATSKVLTDVIVDDVFVGVGAVAADGSESLITFAGPEPRH